MIRETRPQLSVVHIFFYLLILSSPLLAYRYDVGLLQVSLSRLFLVLGLLALIARQLLSGRIKFVNDRWMIPLFFLLLSKVISLFYASNLTVAMRDVFVFIEHILYYYFAIMIVQDWPTLKKGLNLYILSAILPICLGIYQLIGFLNQTPYPLPFQNYLAIAPDNLRIVTHIWGSGQASSFGLNRISASFADPNTFGIFLVLISSFTIPVFLKNYKPWLKMLILSYFTIMMIEVLLTMSRSAVLISLVMIITVMFITNKQSFKKAFARKRKQYGIAFVLIGSIFCFWVINSFTAIHVIDAFIERSNQDSAKIGGSMARHLASIPISLEIAYEHPWGYGKITEGWGEYRHIHFAYFLYVLVHNGILAFLAILYFFWIQIKDVVTWTRRVSSMDSKCPSVDYVFRLGSLPFLVSVVMSLAIYDTLNLPWLWIGFGLIRSYLLFLRKSYYMKKAA